MQFYIITIKIIYFIIFINIICNNKKMLRPSQAIASERSTHYKAPTIHVAQIRIIIISSPTWNRTKNQQLRRMLLYPLSYGTNTIISTTNRIRTCTSSTTQKILSLQRLPIPPSWQVSLSGFEPKPREPKSLVLPLHHREVNTIVRIIKMIVF